MLWKYRKQVAYTVGTIIGVVIYCLIVGMINVLGFTYLTPGINRLTLSFVSLFLGMIPAYYIFYVVSRFIHVKLTWMNV